VGETRWIARGTGVFMLGELAVAGLVIGILTALALAILVSRKDPAYDARVQSAVKAAATAVESFATGENGSYLALDGKTGADAELIDNGYRAIAGVTVTVAADDGAFCVTGTDEGASSTWRYTSAAGTVEAGSCSSATG
jgi:hypothetical protein